jgi:hypothetical protein
MISVSRRRRHDGFQRRHSRDQQGGGSPNSPRDRVLERSQIVPVDIEEAFALFADAWNLEAITLPWLRFRPAPLRPLTGLFAPITVQQWLTEIFDYRARQTAARLTGEHALLA